MITLGILLILHFMADFVLQNDWMATNKSKNVWALTVHVLVYTGMFAFALLFIHDSVGLNYYVSWKQFWLFVGMLAGLHFITDALTSRITSDLWAKGERHWFFVMIGLDQLLHVWQLIWVARVCGWGR